MVSIKNVLNSHQEAVSIKNQLKASFWETITFRATRIKINGKTCLLSDHKINDFIAKKFNSATVGKTDAAVKGFFKMAAYNDSISGIYKGKDLAQRRGDLLLKITQIKKAQPLTEKSSVDSWVDFLKTTIQDLPNKPFEVSGVDYV